MIIVPARQHLIRRVEQVAGPERFNVAIAESGIPFAGVPSRFCNTSFHIPSGVQVERKGKVVSPGQGECARDERITKTNHFSGSRYSGLPERLILAQRGCAPATNTERAYARRPHFKNTVSVHIVAAVASVTRSQDLRSGLIGPREAGAAIEIVAPACPRVRLYFIGPANNSRVGLIQKKRKACVVRSIQGGSEKDLPDVIRAPRALGGDFRPT